MLNYVIIGLSVVQIIILLKILRDISNSGGRNEDIKLLKDEIENSNSRLRRELTDTIQSSINNLGKMLSDSQKTFAEGQSSSLLSNKEAMSADIRNMQKSINEQITNMSTIIEKRLSTSAMENENKLETIRKTVATGLDDMRNDNNKKIDEMRQTVDEKLQKTLEEKISKSFGLVSSQLQQVYEGLGEMKNLASGVGDLKKVLSNVKTRGILGEVQLGAILSEILAPEQYATNIVTKKGSRDPVEFAVKLPTEDGVGIYLPIDSKFPGDTYSHLVEAYESGNKENIDAAAKELANRITASAKDISDKYIDPPNTTDFAIMFLPFEGLYSEVVNRGMVEELQRKYRVNIAGPSTMAALLNSLQMGFKTFAIQKRSSEVWKVLGAVKTEFNKFGTVLEKTQKRLEEANKELDTLVGTRTRSIQRKLTSVESLSEDLSMKILSDGNSDDNSDDEI